MTIVAGLSARWRAWTRACPDADQEIPAPVDPHTHPISDRPLTLEEAILVADVLSDEPLNMPMLARLVQSRTDLSAASMLTMPMKEFVTLAHRVMSDCRVRAAKDTRDSTWERVLRAYEGGRPQ
jgi:hypothetical protein